MTGPRAQSIDAVLRVLRDARHFARIQAKAAVDGGARARWNQQRNYLEGAIEGLESGVKDADAGTSTELQDALDKSVKLQSHYAQLLNVHDGGSRLTFADADAWMKRLASFRKNAASS